MHLLIALIAAVLFTFIFRIPLKKMPWLFYILAIVADIVFTSHILFQVAPTLARALFPYMQRCLFAFGLFAIVMFIGVLPEGSKLRRMLMPIRAELSIVAAILTIGHVINYLNSYLAQIFSPTAVISTNLVFSFLVSAILIILLALLTITSFNVVRRKMHAASWKKLQKLAYPFFILTYVHLVLILFPTATAMNQKPLISVGIYTILMLAYIILRVRKSALDKKAAEAPIAKAQEPAPAC